MDSARIEAAAADWIARRDRGDWTDADEAQLLAWRDESVAHRVALVRLESAWSRADAMQLLASRNLPAADLVPALRGIHEPREGFGGWSAGRLALAASVLLLVAGTVSWFAWLQDSSAYRTGVGGMEAVPLADGSHVTLNTSSRIRVSLGERERRVDLDEGEAFFDVSKDPSRPFVVHAGDQRIVVIGTRFSVLRVGDDVRVIVTEGQVRIEPPAARQATAQPARLAAGAIARATDGGVTIQQVPVTDAEQYLTWRSGYLTFRETPLIEAVAEFNRYNTRKLVIGDPAIAGMRIGANMKATNVHAFVRVLEQGFPVRATQSGDQIILTAR